MSIDDEIQIMLDKIKEVKAKGTLNEHLSKLDEMIKTTEEGHQKIGSTFMDILNSQKIINVPSLKGILLAYRAYLRFGGEKYILLKEVEKKSEAKEAFKFIKESFKRYKIIKGNWYSWKTPSLKEFVEKIELWYKFLKKQA